jgi:hypothetical protein
MWMWTFCFTCLSSCLFLLPTVPTRVSPFPPFHPSSLFQLYFGHLLSFFLFFILFPPLIFTASCICLSSRKQSIFIIYHSHFSLFTFLSPSSSAVSHWLDSLSWIFSANIKYSSDLSSRISFLSAFDLRHSS